MDVATSFLPEELELAPQDISDEGMHPVVFAFGHQSHVMPAVGIEAFDISYLEFIHAVPYTQFKEGLGYPNRGPFCYSPVLYLANNEFSTGQTDATIAVLLGWFYGLEKEFASIDAADTAAAGFHHVTTKIGGLPIIGGTLRVLVASVPYEFNFCAHIKRCFSIAFFVAVQVTGTSLATSFRHQSSRILKLRSQQ